MLVTVGPGREDAVERVLMVVAVIATPFALVVGFLAGDVLLVVIGAAAALLLVAGFLQERLKGPAGGILPIDDELRVDLIDTRRESGDVAAVKELRRRRPGMPLLDAKRVVDSL